MKARIESLSEYHDPLKMDSMILPAVTVLFSVLATGFFVNAKMINGSTNSMQVSGFTVTGFWIFTIITFILFVLRPGKKKHSKIIFLVNWLTYVLKRKNRKKSKKKREESRKRKNRKSRKREESRQKKKRKKSSEKIVIIS